MPFNILILCTGNSARSILGEAILQREGKGRIKAFSAGSQPKERPNPFALKLLQAEGFEVSAFSSKSWDVFAGANSERIDLAITVCDSAAGESCPVFVGAPLRAHWGLEDPAASIGSDQEIETAFKRTFEELTLRAKALIALPFETMPPDALREELRRIGQMQGATALSRNVKTGQ
jgi:arsenate reductase (thioredoxin)